MQCVQTAMDMATVVSVVPGSPADKAEPERTATSLRRSGTQDTRDISLAMIQLLLHGQRLGSELTLAVIRPRQGRILIRSC